MNLLLLCLLGQPAFAQDPAPEDPLASVPDKSPVAVGLRYASLSLPHSALNAWFHDTGDPIMLDFERPDAGGYAVGLEVSPHGFASGVRGYIEYAKINLEPGYWDAKDTDASSLELPGDGDWVESNGLGWVGLGAEYRHNMILVEPEADWQLGLHMSAGLGLGVTLGSISQWYGNNAPDYEDPSCKPAMLAPERTDCAVDFSPKLPPAVPILDLALGLNAQIAERVDLQIEGGMHNLPFFGFGISTQL